MPCGMRPRASRCAARGDIATHFPWTRPLKKPVLIDAQASRDASGSSVSATFSTSATSPMSTSSACRPREAFADLVVRSRLCGRRHAAGRALSAARTLYVPYVLYVGYVVGRRREQAPPSPSSGRRIEGIGSEHLGPQLLPHSLAFPRSLGSGGRRRYRKSPYGRAPCLGNPYVSYVSYVV